MREFIFKDFSDIFCTIGYFKFTVHNLLSTYTVIISSHFSFLIHLTILAVIYREFHNSKDTFSNSRAKRLIDFKRVLSSLIHHPSQKYKIGGKKSMLCSWYQKRGRESEYITKEWGDWNIAFDKIQNSIAIPDQKWKELGFLNMI